MRYFFPRRAGPILITMLFLMSGLVTFASGTSEQKTIETSFDQNGIHIDLNYYDDEITSYEYVSNHRDRTIRIEDGIVSSSVFSVERVDLRVEMRSFSILDSNRTRSDNDAYIYGRLSQASFTHTDPVRCNRLKISKDTEFDVDFTSTISGIKETIILHDPPGNLSSDLVIGSTFNLDSGIGVGKKVSQGVWNQGEGDLDLILAKSGETMFTIPEPVLFTSADTIKTQTGSLMVQHTVKRVELSYRFKVFRNMLYYDILIPRSILSSDDIEYPLYIDPSITSFSGYSYYKGYDNGTISVYDGSSYEWYPGSARTVFLDSDITISSGESLIFDNVIVKANTDDLMIEVEDGGLLGLLNQSRLTRSSSSDGYSVVFKHGSSGSVINSTVEKSDYQDGFRLESSDIIVYNSVFRTCEGPGIYVWQSNPQIWNSSFYNCDIGVHASPFSNPILVGNRFNDTRIGVKIDSSNLFEDLSTSERIEKLIGTGYTSGKVEYALGEENIALSCPYVTVDSEWSSDYSKEEMYDGITNTNANKWSSDSSTEPHYAIFDFQEVRNVSRFVIYHQPNVPTYDFQIQTYQNSQWTTRFTIDDNSERVTYHNLSSSVLAEKVRLNITDANQALDSTARIREFQIYGPSSNMSCHYMLTKPINLYGDSIYSSLKLDKVEPGSSRIFTSVVDGDTDLTIPGFYRLENDVIDLKNIDTDLHTSIKIKTEFQSSGADEPTLEGFTLKFSSLKTITNPLSDSSDLVSSSNVMIRDGAARLEPIDIDIYESWNDGWESNWTITELQDGGDYEMVEDHWADSGNDIHMEGTSLTPSSGHDGRLYLSRFFGEVSPNMTLQTHFKGKIDSNVYNYADVLLTLFDSTNSTKRRIWWTTRDYSYNGGLFGDTYYHVAQENDTISPYTYDVVLNGRLGDVFESRFGTGQINWSVYRYLEFKVLNIENYGTPDFVSDKKNL